MALQDLTPFLSLQAVEEAANMRKLIAIFALLFSGLCGSQTPLPTEAELIAYTKRIDVATLDPTLPSQTLEEWLRVDPARVNVVAWRAGINSCGDKPDPPEPTDGFEVCATILFRKNGVNGHIILTLGTFQKGIAESPRFKYAQIGAFPAIEYVYKLSDIPPALEELQQNNGAGLVKENGARSGSS